jgi:hypothetical protein
VRRFVEEPKIQRLEKKRSISEEAEEAQVEKRR